jgi:phospholipase C
MRSILRLVIAALGALGLATVSSVDASAARRGPCGTRSLSSTDYTHVIWIWMENQSYDNAIGSSSTPYINGLAAECGLAVNYHNITHPSLPNYIAATSGLPLGRLARFTSDCDPAGECRTPARSIFSEASSWKGYAESMPQACASSNSGEYAVRHNPPPYYTTLAGCDRRDVPYRRLAADLAHKHLPAFSFITPSVIHDMHDGGLGQGDAWLKTSLAMILRSRDYRRGKVVVFITWDEGEGGSSNVCARNTADVGCHIATIVISPSTRRGTRSGKLFNHYSLLATSEQLLRLGRLGRARGAASMRSAFNL